MGEEFYNIQQQKLAIKKKGGGGRNEYPSFKVRGKYFTISTQLKVTLKSLNPQMNVKHRNL